MASEPRLGKRQIEILDRMRRGEQLWWYAFANNTITPNHITMTAALMTYFVVDGRRDIQPRASVERLIDRGLVVCDEPIPKANCFADPKKVQLRLAALASAPVRESDG